MGVGGLGLGIRGLGFGGFISGRRVEKQMEKNMETQMEAGFLVGVIVVVCRSLSSSNRSLWHVMEQFYESTGVARRQNHQLYYWILVGNKGV